MLTYIWTYDTLKIDTTFTNPTEAAYPNKSFLEVINFDYPVGSVDPDNGINFWEIIRPFSDLWIITYIINLARDMPMPKPWQPLKGWGSELRKRIKQALKKYYGENWQNDPNAKIILIADLKSQVFEKRNKK